MPLKYVRVTELSDFSNVFNANKSEKDVSFKFAMIQQVQGKVAGILECFEQAHAIENLSLDFTHHQLNATDIFALANFLQSPNCPGSIEIILTSTELDIQSLAILSQVIANSCKASSVSLNIANNRLGNQCISVLTNILSSSNAPEKLTLNLASNRITDDGIGELTELIKCNTSNTKDLSVNLLFNQTTENGSLILVEALRSVNQKEKFKINYEFGKHGIGIISSLADALRLRTSSTALSLQFGVQHLSAREIAMIFNAISNISEPQEIELDLSEQCLGDAGFIDILNILNRMNTDTSLRLYLIYNSIKDDGAKALAQFIRTSSITNNLFIDVSQNAFGGEVGNALIRSAIEENPDILAYLSLVGPSQEITSLCQSMQSDILSMTNRPGLR